MARKGDVVAVIIMSLAFVWNLKPGASRLWAQLGAEVSVPVHWQDGEEYQRPVRDLIAYGEKLFTARWTIQEGAGRPLTKGTGVPLSDPSDPLVFPRNFKRLSGLDTNACSGCHNLPQVGGGGESSWHSVFTSLSIGPMRFPPARRAG